MPKAVLKPLSPVLKKSKGFPTAIGMGSQLWQGDSRGESICFLRLDARLRLQNRVEQTFE